MPGVKGRSGPKRKPKRHHELVGDHHVGRLNSDEPPAVGGKLVMFAKLNPTAQAVWDYYRPMLKNNGTVGRQDSMALTVLCRTVAEWVKLDKRVQKCGRTLQKRNRLGEVIDVKIAPWSKIEKELRTDMWQMFRDFGLTPVSRSSVHKIAAGDDAKPILGVT